jgi:hypothetical protein
MNAITNTIDATIAPNMPASFSDSIAIFPRTNPAIMCPIGFLVQ